VTSTWRRTTFSRDSHPCPWRDSNPRSQQAGGRRPRDHRNCYVTILLVTNRTL